MKLYLAGVVEPDTWDDLLEELETSRKLSRKAIARRMRGTHKPMPHKIKMYLADYLDPRVGGNTFHGFNKPSDPYIDQKRESLRMRITPILKRYTRFVRHIQPNRVNITYQFIDLFSEKHGISERELRKILKH